MKKRIVAALAASVLAATFVSVNLLAGAYFDYLLSRYPGSVRLVGERFDFYYLDRGWISRQAVYRTEDELTAVRSWYVALFGVVPESVMHEAGNCIWLRKSKVTFRIEHTVSVLVCAVLPGTRISVNESVHLYLWP